MLQFRNSSDSKILDKFKERATKNCEVKKDPYTVGGHQSGWRVTDGLHVWVVVHNSKMNQWEIYNNAEGIMDCDPFKLLVKFDNEKIEILSAEDGGRKLKADRSLKKFMQLATYINCFYLTGFFQEKATKEKKMSTVLGIMLQHSDGDKEYYEPEFSKEDVAAIYQILEKYGENNESIRGNLEVINKDE